MGQRSTVKKKISIKDILESAFTEMGLSEDEFFHQPPYKFYLRQLNYHRKLERNWEQTRMIVAGLYNTAYGNKHRYKPQNIIPLSIDEVVEHYEFDEALMRKAIAAWKPINNN